MEALPCWHSRVSRGGYTYVSRGGAARTRSRRRSCTPPSKSSSWSRCVASTFPRLRHRTPPHLPCIPHPACIADRSAASRLPLPRHPQLVVSKGKFKDIGQKTDKDDKIEETQLKELLAFDPSKTALGRQENSKIITDEELAIVLDRSGGTKTGKGFMAVEKVTNSFDALGSAR